MDENPYSEHMPSIKAGSTIEASRRSADHIPSQKSHQLSIKTIDYDDIKLSEARRATDNLSPETKLFIE